MFTGKSNDMKLFKYCDLTNYWRIWWVTCASTNKWLFHFPLQRLFIFENWKIFWSYSFFLLRKFTTESVELHCKIVIQNRNKANTKPHKSISLSFLFKIAVLFLFFTMENKNYNFKIGFYCGFWFCENKLCPEVYKYTQ